MTVEEKRKILADYCNSRCCDSDKENGCPLLETPFDCGNSFEGLDNEVIEDCYNFIFGDKTENYMIS